MHESMQETKIGKINKMKNKNCTEKSHITTTTKNPLTSKPKHLYDINLFEYILIHKPNQFQKLFHCNIPSDIHRFTADKHNILEEVILKIIIYLIKGETDNPKRVNIVFLLYLDVEMRRKVPNFMNTNQFL